MDEHFTFHFHIAQTLIYLVTNSKYLQNLVNNMSIDKFWILSYVHIGDSKIDDIIKLPTVL